MFLLSRHLLSTLLIFFSIQQALAQSSSTLIYVDKQGVMRYTKDNKEAAFFGVNYTVPFAYGYRSHKALGVDLEKAIDADVYHMSRLGLDAFRVHVWDVEISDSLGNLKENEHLRLFDYLIAQLEKRNIRILITPIAFWGNGYPEKDERTSGFSYVYGKDKAVVNDAAIKAQENYLQQIMKHINPYTKQSYKDDPNIIAAEINNEPHHSGPKENVTEYVNRLAKAIRSTGWSKPIFYNISESPAYADAIAKADVQGHSFQWYPTGLVAGHEQKGNFLPNVDQYIIPYIDTMPAFRNKARAVYEFDAGDVLQPIMYPAMVRSFRTAGFQWATQFAYDPMATAYANTEYQTHYLNLAYTPAKAISLLIGSKAFHMIPRGKSYGIYPADTSFDVFRVSYQQQLSEMNSDEEFYYSNITSDQPKNKSRLKHIAGVGSSPIVQYTGTGAYFLDKLQDGIWRLEVLPDAITVRDPFGKASPQREVTKLVAQAQSLRLFLPDMNSQFSVVQINEGASSGPGLLEDGSLWIKPGVYILTSNGKAFKGPVSKEFAVPTVRDNGPVMVHQPVSVVTEGAPFPIRVILEGVDTSAKLSVELRNSSNRWKTVELQRISTIEFIGQVPADMITPGLINYRIMVHTGNEIYTFPGGYKGDPYAWDNVHNDSWQTYVAAKQTPVTVFNPAQDRETVMLYNPDWRNNHLEYITGEYPEQLVMKLTLKKSESRALMGFQTFFADRIKGRLSELSGVHKIVIRARTDHPTPVSVRVGLINTDAQAYVSNATLTNEWKDIEIPFTNLKKDSCLLLPRPYPGFQPLWFLSSASKAFDIRDMEKLEISFGQNLAANASCSIEVASVRFVNSE